MIWRGWLGSAMLKTTSFGTKCNDQRGSGHTARSRWELLSGQQSFWWRIWGRCRLGCLVISRVDEEDGWWGTLLHMMKMVGWVGWGVGQQMTLGSLLTTNLATHHYWKCVCSSQLTSSTHHNLRSLMEHLPYYHPKSKVTLLRTFPDVLLSQMLS